MTDQHTDQNDDVHVYAAALRGSPPVLCHHCGDELEAVGERRVTLILSGTRPYVWRHVDGTEECVLRPPRGRPYDDFAAHRQIEKWDAEHRCRVCGEIPCDDPMRCDEWDRESSTWR